MTLSYREGSGFVTESFLGWYNWGATWDVWGSGGGGSIQSKNSHFPSSQVMSFTGSLCGQRKLTNVMRPEVSLVLFVPIGVEPPLMLWIPFW